MSTLKLAILFSILFLLVGVTQATDTCPQKFPLRIDIKMLQKIKNHIDLMQPGSSNANDMEKLIGSPCSCFVWSVSNSAGSWACQWKGNLSSNRIEDTLTISFEAGMLTNVIAKTSDGTGYEFAIGDKIKRYTP